MTTARMQCRTMYSRWQSLPMAAPRRWKPRDGEIHNERFGRVIHRGRRDVGDFQSVRLNLVKQINKTWNVQPLLAEGLLIAVSHLTDHHRRHRSREARTTPCVCLAHSVASVDTLKVLQYTPQAVGWRYSRFFVWPHPRAACMNASSPAFSSACWTGSSSAGFPYGLGSREPSRRLLCLSALTLGKSGLTSPSAVDQPTAVGHTRRQQLSSQPTHLFDTMHRFLFGSDPFSFFRTPVSVCRAQKAPRPVYASCALGVLRGSRRSTPDSQRCGYQCAPTTTTSSTDTGDIHAKGAPCVGSAQQQASSIAAVHAGAGSDGSTGCAAIGAVQRRPEEQDPATSLHVGGSILQHVTFAHLAHTTAPLAFSTKKPPPSQASESQSGTKTQCSPPHIIDANDNLVPKRQRAT